VRRPLLLPSLVITAALALGACGTDTGPESAATTEMAPPAPTTTASTVPPRVGPIRVLVVGDSVMLQIGEALKQWSDQNPGQIEVMSKAHLGCGTTRGGQKRYASGTGSNGEVCATWAEPVDPATLSDPEVVSWITEVQVFQPDVVLGYASGWDAIDRQVPQLGDAWYKPGDAPYDEFVRSEYAEALAVLSSTGANVVWLSTPCTNHPDDPAADPARTERLNEIVAPLVEALPRHTSVDWRGYLGPCGAPRDLELRADGDHITRERLPEVSEWLAARLIAAGTENRSMPVG
jgi:hypothetical protein